MQSQYRDPPPYPGHSKQIQPGTHQSFSGSEASTDVSVSSMENLAMTQRQDPQGEETQHNVYSHLDMSTGNSNYSILARLGMPTNPADIVKPDSSGPTYFITGPPQGKVYSVQTDPTVVYSQGQLTSLQPPLSSPHLLPQTNISQVPLHYNQNMISAYRPVPTYVNSQWSPHSSMDETQSNQLISYAANLPPPPDYPGPVMTELSTPKESPGKIELTKSQPDLSRLSEPMQKVSIHGFASDPKFSAQTMCDVPHGEELDHAAIAARTTQIIEMLSDENRRLRDDLDINYRKVSKLQKFEFEIQKVHEGYESLVKSSEKRERLEGVMKKRLESELKKVKVENTVFRDKIDTLQKSKLKRSLSTNEKENTIERLLAHNKELLNEAENTGKKNKWDEKQSVEKAKFEEVQKAFISLQSASEKREIMERQLRSKLERELESLRNQQKHGWRRGSDEDVEKVGSMKQLLIDKDASILEMQTEVAKWEERYLEQVTLRQLEDHVGTKDMRLAALERTSADTEKLIDEAKMEKLKHMEELYQSNRKVAELEARVKSLQTQVCEKEAMVKVFQRSPMARSSSVHTIYCSPLHSPRPSIISTTSSLGPSIKHVKTGSASAIESRSAEEKLRDKLKVLHTGETTTNKNDTEEEGKMLLWQV